MSQKLGIAVTCESSTKKQNKKPKKKNENQKKKLLSERKDSISVDDVTFGVKRNPQLSFQTLFTGSMNLYYFSSSEGGYNWYQNVCLWIYLLISLARETSKRKFTNWVFASNAFISDQLRSSKVENPRDKRALKIYLVGLVKKLFFLFEVDTTDLLPKALHFWFVHFVAGCFQGALHSSSLGLSCGCPMRKSFQS